MVGAETKEETQPLPETLAKAERKGKKQPNFHLPLIFNLPSAFYWLKQARSQLARESRKRSLQRKDRERI